MFFYFFIVASNTQANDIQNDDNFKLSGNSLKTLKINGVDLNDHFYDENNALSDLKFFSKRGCNQQIKDYHGLTDEQEKLYLEKSARFMVNAYKKINPKHYQYSNNTGSRETAEIITLGEKNKVLALSFQKFYKHSINDVISMLEETLNFSIKNLTNPSKRFKNNLESGYKGYISLDATSPNINEYIRMYRGKPPFDIDSLMNVYNTHFVYNNKLGDYTLTEPLSNYIFMIIKPRGDRGGYVKLVSFGDMQYILHEGKSFINSCKLASKKMLADFGVNQKSKSDRESGNL